MDRNDARSCPSGFPWSRSMRRVVGANSTLVMRSASTVRKKSTGENRGNSTVVPPRSPCQETRRWPGATEHHYALGRARRPAREAEGGHVARRDRDGDVLGGTQLEQLTVRRGMG